MVIIFIWFYYSCADNKLNIQSLKQINIALFPHIMITKTEKDIQFHQNQFQKFRFSARIFNWLLHFRTSMISHRNQSLMQMQRDPCRVRLTHLMKQVEMQELSRLPPTNLTVCLSKITKLLLVGLMIKLTAPMLIHHHIL